MRSTNGGSLCALGSGRRGECRPFPKRITYSYDANGNTEVVNDDGGLTTYSWDVENHMTLVELAGGTLNTITYDGDGKRREYEDSAGLRTFIWDGENILLQTDSGGTTNRDYTGVREGGGER